MVFPTLHVSWVGSTSGVVRKRQLTITQPKRYSSSDDEIMLTDRYRNETTLLHHSNHHTLPLLRQNTNPSPPLCHTCNTLPPYMHIRPTNPKLPHPNPFPIPFFAPRDKHQPRQPSLHRILPRRPHNLKLRYQRIHRVSRQRRTSSWVNVAA
jgi:hypothetical protein